MADPRSIVEEPGPADLSQEAEVTERDRAIAPRFWAHYATPLLKRLLDARKAEK